MDYNIQTHWSNCQSLGCKPYNRRKPYCKMPRWGCMQLQLELCITAKNLVSNVHTSAAGLCYLLCFANIQAQSSLSKEFEFTPDVPDETVIACLAIRVVQQ